MRVQTQPHSTQTRTYAQTVKRTPKMEEFIEEFMNERPDEVDVLLPVTNDLRPENSYLAYAANISFAIKCTMVDLHGGTLELYQVHKLEREAYFIICVNQTVRYAIVQQGPYKIPIARV